MYGRCDEFYVLLTDFSGQSLKDLVPPKERLLDAMELEKLPDQESFKYLLSIAYEHFEHVLSK